MDFTECLAEEDKRAGRVYKRMTPACRRQPAAAATSSACIPWLHANARLAARLGSLRQQRLQGQLRSEAGLIGRQPFYLLQTETSTSKAEMNWERRHDDHCQALRLRGAGNCPNLLPIDERHDTSQTCDADLAIFSSLIDRSDLKLTTMWRMIMHSHRSSLQVMGVHTALRTTFNSLITDNRVGNSVTALSYYNLMETRQVYAKASDA